MNKIALITGATAGIGEATAKLLAKNGYNLILTGRRKERLDKISSQISNVKVLTLAFDVRNNHEVEKAFQGIPEEWRNVDILLNNAGLAAGFGSIQDCSLSDWEQMIDTNLKGLLYVSKQIIPWMIARKSGHIINLGSIAGKETYPNGNVYCATKHAVDSLTQAMRLDLLEHGIKVTQICPGLVETEFALVRFKGDAGKAKQVYQGMEPLTAEDIAEAIWWSVNRPAHVNISDMLIMPTAQANTYKIHRK